LSWLTSEQASVSNGQSSMIQAAPSLLNAIQNGNEDDRVFSVRALIGIGVESREGIEVLIQAMRNSQLRRDAATALGTAGTGGALAIPTLESALQDGDEEVRRTAVAALAEIGPIAKVVLPDIEKLLRDPVFLVRVLSAAAQWKLSGHAEPALTSLQESFDHGGGDR
jgi:HEAT repeat protein